MNSLIAFFLAFVFAAPALAQIMSLGVGGAPTAVFPTVQTTAVTSCVATATCSVNLPASIASGDMLLVCDYQTGNGRAVSLPAGWTSILFDNSAGIGEMWCVEKHPASGSEGATVSITINSSSTWATVAYRVSPASAISAGTLTNGSLDPPNLTPGTTVNFLWIVTCGEAYSTQPTLVPPANYGSLTQAPGTIETVGLMWRQLNAASENPAACTNSGGTGAGQQGANTLAIAP